jgi:hypothetical protein
MTISSWACPECGERAIAPGACVHCGHGTLVDLGDSINCELLRFRDRRLAEEHAERLLGASTALVVVLWCSIGLASYPVMVALLSVPGPLVLVGVLIVTALATSRLLETIFPAKPRFPYLSR